MLYEMRLADQLFWIRLDPMWHNCTKRWCTRKRPLQVLHIEVYVSRPLVAAELACLPVITITSCCLSDPLPFDCRPPGWGMLSHAPSKRRRWAAPFGLGFSRVCPPLSPWLEWKLVPHRFSLSQNNCNSCRDSCGGMLAELSFFCTYFWRPCMQVLNYTRPSSYNWPCMRSLTAMLTFMSQVSTKAMMFCLLLILLVLKRKRTATAFNTLQAFVELPGHAKQSPARPLSHCSNVCPSRWLSCWDL